MSDHWAEQIRVAMRYAIKIRKVQEEEIFKFSEGKSALIIGWEGFYEDLCKLPFDAKFEIVQK